MKDTRGYGSNPRGELAAHQSGISELPSAAGRELYAALSAYARERHPDYHSGLSEHELNQSWA